MAELMLDSIRPDEIEAFLVRLYDIGVQNNLDYNHDTIYNELRSYGLKESDKIALGDFKGMAKSVDRSFKQWPKDFDENHQIHVFVDPGWPYFCQFCSDPMIRSEYIKLYIPLDYDHIYEGAKQLFEFVAEQGIMHQSKIGKRIGSDNVIIRLDGSDMDSLNKIIEFIDHNSYIQEGLNKTNPFISNIHGIGYMKETGISYNSEISHLISDYLNQKIKAKERPDSKDFAEWFSNHIKNYNSETAEEVMRIFEDCVNANDRRVDKEFVSEERQLTSSQKNRIFIDAVMATFDKYGYLQVQTAIHRVLEQGDYSYFTNGPSKTPNYRDLLQDYVSSADIKKYMDATLFVVDDLYQTQEELISKYLNTILENALSHQLDEICRVTYQRHGVDKLRTALSEYSIFGYIGGFSRYDGNDQTINYRENMNNFSLDTFDRAMRDSLSNQGIECENLDIDVLIDLYAKQIEKSYYRENLSQK